MPCGAGNAAPSRRAGSVSVIGERESGTKFGLALINANSPTYARDSTDVAGWKHAIGYGAAMCDRLRGTDQLVIVVFRRARLVARCGRIPSLPRLRLRRLPHHVSSALDCCSCAGFFAHPWHSRYHCELPTVYDFVTREFGPGAGPPGALDNWKCANHEVDHEEFYWQRDGRYASNLMEARRWWAESWLAAADCAPDNVVTLRYEQMMGDEGVGFTKTLQDLHNRAGVSLELGPAFPTQVYDRLGSSVRTSKAWGATAYARHRSGDTAALLEMGLDQRTVDAIVERLDKDVEQRLGYNYAMGIHTEVPSSSF